MHFLRKYIGDFYLLRQIIYLFFIIALMTLSCDCFSYVNLNHRNVNIATKFICLLFFLFFVIKRPFGPKYHFYYFVLFFSLFPFLSIVNSLSIFNQGIKQGLIATLPSCIWLLYFVLHYLNVKEGTILRAFLLTGLFIVSVQIIQQLTYPEAIFGVFTEEEAAENYLGDEIAKQRNGLWRFTMANNMYYTAPFLFAAWVWLRKRFDIRLLFIIALFLISTYLSLTRQVIAAMLLTLFLSIFWSTKRRKWRTLLLVVLIVWGCYEFYDVLFASLEVKEDEDSLTMRLYAYQYFWRDSLRNISTFLFGLGVSSGSGAFAQYQHHLAKDLNCFVSDVGAVGAIWRHGLFYVLTCYYFAYYLFFKQKKNLPMYIRLFVVYVFVMSLMIFPMGIGLSRNIMWPLLLYIIDLHINQSPLALPTTASSQL